MNKQEYDRVSEYRDAAVADGWLIKPTYSTEDVNRAATLEKDGFKMMIITRQLPEGRTKDYSVSMAVYGPDGLIIEPPKVYSMTEIVRRVNYCKHCDSHDVKTHRYSFAGRACASCLPGLKNKHEKPGWTR